MVSTHMARGGGQSWDEGDSQEFSLQNTHLLLPSVETGRIKAGCNGFKGVGRTDDLSFKHIVSSATGHLNGAATLESNDIPVFHHLHSKNARKINACDNYHQEIAYSTQTSVLWGETLYNDILSSINTEMPRILCLHAYNEHYHGKDWEILKQRSLLTESVSRLFLFPQVLWHPVERVISRNWEILQYSS